MLSSAGEVTTANGEHIARMWNTESGKLLREFAFANGVVLGSQFTTNGTRVFATTDRSGARIWDTVTGTPLDGYDAHRGLVRIAAFSADGLSALTADITADRTGESVIWDAQSGAPRTKLYGVVTTATFDSTGERIATGNSGRALLSRNTDRVAGRVFRRRQERDHCDYV